MLRKGAGEGAGGRGEGERPGGSDGRRFGVSGLRRWGEVGGGVEEEELGTIGVAELSLADNIKLLYHFTVDFGLTLLFPAQYERCWLLCVLSSTSLGLRCG